MKQILLITMILMTQNALAQVKSYSYASRDPGCPNILKIYEKIERNTISKIMIVKGNQSSNQVSMYKIACENLAGTATTQNDGNRITCVATANKANGYTLKVVYVQPPRDPSDYGLQETYVLEKSSGGVMAYWGATRYDGKPVYCEYR